MDNGRAIATRLQSVTTNKSGLGLLFLMVGDESKNEAKLVVSRFPADSAILAEQREGELTVQFLERVFMKSATAYKAVVYRGVMTSTAFWTGKAVDKQINLGVAAISNYWIRDFLASDFRTTSAAGTRRLAEALRTATSTATDVTVRSEIVAAVRLARGMDGQTLSITSLLARLGLSDAAKGAACAHIPEHLLTEQFRLDADEFERHLPIRSVELDNGGLMMAPTPSFDEVFKREQVAGGERVRFVAEGVVIDDKLRKGRR